VCSSDLAPAAILAALMAGEGDRAAELFRKHTNVQGDVLAEYIALAPQ